MANTVGRGAGGVPVVHAEVGVPAGVGHVTLGNLLPAVAGVDLKAGFHRFTRLEREELSSHFQRGSLVTGGDINGVDRKRDHVVSGDIEGERAALGLLGPPRAGAPAIECGHLVAEGRGGQALLWDEFSCFGSRRRDGQQQ